MFKIRLYNIFINNLFFINVLHILNSFNVYKSSQSYDKIKQSIHYNVFDMIQHL